MQPILVILFEEGRHASITTDAVEYEFQLGTVARQEAL